MVKMSSLQPMSVEERMEHLLPKMSGNTLPAIVHLDSSSMISDRKKITCYSPFNIRTSYTSHQPGIFLVASRHPSSSSENTDNSQLSKWTNSGAHRYGEGRLGRWDGHVLPAFREMAVVLDNILIEERVVPWSLVFVPLENVSNHQVRYRI